MVVAPTDRKPVPQSTCLRDQTPPAAVAHRVQGEALYRVVLQSMLPAYRMLRPGANHTYSGGEVRRQTMLLYRGRS